MHKFLTTQLQAPPTDRLAAAFVALGMSDEGARTIAAYDRGSAFWKTKPPATTCSSSPKRLAMSRPCSEKSARSADSSIAGYSPCSLTPIWARSPATTSSSRVPARVPVSSIAQRHRSRARRSVSRATRGSRPDSLHLPPSYAELALADVAGGRLARRRLLFHAGRHARRRAPSLPLAPAPRARKAPLGREGAAAGIFFGRDAPLHSRATVRRGRGPCQTMRPPANPRCQQQAASGPVLNPLAAQTSRRCRRRPGHRRAARGNPRGRTRARSRVRPRARAQRPRSRPPPSPSPRPRRRHQLP